MQIIAVKEAPSIEMVRSRGAQGASSGEKIEVIRIRP